MATAADRNGAKRSKTTTPWGQSRIVEEARVPQAAGDKRFTALFQLLESDAGELLVRIAYTTGGVVRRGPVTLRERDLRRLASALRTRPGLASALGFTGGDV